MPNKKNILFVNGHLNAGGVERSLVDLLKHFDFEKFNIDLLLLEDTGDYFSEVPQQVNIILKDTRNAYGALWATMWGNIKARNWFCIKFRLIALAIRFFGKYWYKFLAKILSTKPQYDAAIAFRVGISADIIAHGIKAPKKLCWWHHGAIEPTDDLTQLDYFNYIVAVSGGVKEMLIASKATLSNHIQTIPNMVDVEQICKMGNMSENPYNDNSVLNFVTVGRIVIEKHIENVVEAAVRMRADGRLNFKWHVVGDGELYDDIAKRINEANIEEQVILCGRKPNPYPYIKYADMMIHTSHIESQGLVIQEAMALGTPCVVTRSVGPSEFIVDGENGVMVEPTVESLIEGIYRLAEDKALQAKIIVNGQATLTQGYTPEIVIDKIEKLIEE